MPVAPCLVNDVSYDSRTKVLNKKFNLGVSQRTHLYDFTSSFCGVTQGNPAKHMSFSPLDTRRWRKLQWKVPDREKFS